MTLEQPALALLGGPGLTRTASFGLITYSEHALTSLSILFLFNNKEPYRHDYCVPTCFYVILGDSKVGVVHMLMSMVLSEDMLHRSIFRSKNLGHTCTKYFSFPSVLFSNPT